MEPFVTLQFPGEPITPTRIVVYCLDMQELRARVPRTITLFSSTTESIYPQNEIHINKVITEVSSGTTARSNELYIYKKYEIQIPEDKWVAMNYARISFSFEGMNWIAKLFTRMGNSEGNKGGGSGCTSCFYHHPFS